MRLVERLVNLLRGLANGWLGRRERRNPEAVYDAAIQQRVTQYASLRAAAAGVLYMQGKLARDVAARSAELASVERQLAIAVERDDDAAALALIGSRDVLRPEVERLATDLADLTREAEAAKQNLVAFQQAIGRLREEKVRMLARLANAKARLRLHETLSGLAPDADIQALEAVREHVERLAHEVQLLQGGGDPELERRLGGIRDAELASAARAQLAELKRARDERRVPVVVAQPAGAS